MERLSKKLTVSNKLGLHARPAAEFVRCATSFGSDLAVVLPNGDRHNPKSIMDLLTACLSPGESFVLEAHGSDAPEAVATLEALLEDIAVREGHYQAEPELAEA